MKILMICGSGRTPSYTRSLCRAVSDSLSGKGASVEIVVPDRLPFCDPDTRLKREENGNAEVVSLFTEAHAADAIILASPVYHNSCSGLLKNALDWLGMREFRGKAVGLISHGGGSPQPVDHMRIMVRALQAIAIPTQVSTSEAHFGSDMVEGCFPVTDQSILKRIDKFTSELIDISNKLS
jgi:NAD(P)H-dependent FMN reductase